MSYPWTEAARHAPPPRAAEPHTYVPVTRTRRCPVCGSDHWCSIRSDGAEACCMRVTEGAYRSYDLGHGEGHYHHLDRLQHPACPPPRPPPRVEASFALNYAAILARWARHMAVGALDELARSLGVARASLARLGAMYCPERRAWAFPMHDDRRRVIGIRLRAADGAKFSLPGSHSGVFIPTGLDSRSTLLICEGPTDTAAALTLGFQAVGRPSCSGATEILCEMLASGRRRDVVVVADADGPGRLGAKRLADRVVGLSRSVKLITPAPHKDLRAWLQGGATPGRVQLRIDSAYEYSVFA